MFYISLSIDDKTGNVEERLPPPRIAQSESNALISVVGSCAFLLCEERFVSFALGIEIDIGDELPVPGYFIGGIRERERETTQSNRSKTNGLAKEPKTTRE